MSKISDYSRIFDLNNAQLNELNGFCKTHGYAGDENIANVILEDSVVLSSLNLNKNDIYNNHINMCLKLNKTNEFNRYTTFDTNNPIINNLVDSAPTELLHEWSCIDTIVNEIKLNGQHLLILSMHWSEKEYCPIDRYFHKLDRYAPKYHDKLESLDTVYSDSPEEMDLPNTTNSDQLYGNKDYFILNLNNDMSIWVPELVPKQVGKYGFFQGLKSKYRVDPLKYIKVFGIKGHIEILPTTKVKRWLFADFINGKIKGVKDKCEHEFYVAYLFNGGKSMCLRFRNSDFFDSMQSCYINVFNVNMIVGPKQKCSKWMEFSLITDLQLVKDGASDEIRIIRDREELVHIARGKIIIQDIAKDIDPIECLGRCVDKAFDKIDNVVDSIDKYIMGSSGNED